MLKFVCLVYKDKAIQYGLEKGVRMYRVFDEWCRVEKINRDEVRFYFRGSQVDENITVEKLFDSDVIAVIDVQDYKNVYVCWYKNSQYRQSLMIFLIWALTLSFLFFLWQLLEATK